MSNINPNNPPPQGFGTMLFEWIVANILFIKRRINAITGGGSGAGMTIGNPVTDADPDRVLFTDASGNLSQSGMLTYDGATFRVQDTGDEAGPFHVSNSDGTKIIEILPNAVSISFSNFSTATASVLIFQDSEASTATVPAGTGTLLYDTRGEANGIATLDSGGTVPIDQLPFSVAEYKGTWNATNPPVGGAPTLADGVGNNGDFYVVSVGGTQDLGSGNITFAAGNLVIYNGATDVWEKAGGLASATVTSVSSADNTWLTVANGTTTPVLTVVSAPKLATARNINNVAFDGTANILLSSTINAQTGTTYTFLSTDNQKFVTADNTGAQTYTIPAGLTANWETVLFSKNTGSVTIALSGTTSISYNNALTLAGKGAAVTIKHLGSNVFSIIGNLV